MLIAIMMIINILLRFYWFEYCIFYAVTVLLLQWILFSFDYADISKRTGLDRGPGISALFLCGSASRDRPTDNLVADDGSGETNNILQ